MRIESKELVLKEIVIVEGKDDTARLKEVGDIKTIETHGYGISFGKFIEIEKAYREVGIIIFTDPDYAGNTIRKRLKERFPNAKEAFLIKEKAKKNKNIGIENAKKEDIIEALEKAEALWVADKTYDMREESLTEKDMMNLGLIGKSDSKELRTKVGDFFGFGYVNGKKILEKINMYGINKKEISEVLNREENKNGK